MLLKMKMMVKFLRDGEEDSASAKSWTHQVTVLEVRCLSSSVCTALIPFEPVVGISCSCFSIEMAKGQGNHFEMSRARGWRIALFRNLLQKILLTSLQLSGRRWRCPKGEKSRPACSKEWRSCKNPANDW